LTTEVRSNVDLRELLIIIQDNNRDKGNSIPDYIGIKNKYLEKARERKLGDILK